MRLRTLSALTLPTLLALASCGGSSSTTTAEPKPAASTAASTASVGASSPSATTNATGTAAGTAAGAAATTTAAIPAPTPKGPETIQLAKTKLGSVVVDLAGFTVYAFTKDTATASTCTGDCAQTWLAVTGPATAGSGLQADGVATIVGQDGLRQLAYKGHPLYYFKGDVAPGDTKGEGVSGVWFALDASGALVKG